jgi:hypothetical protein
MDAYRASTLGQAQIAGLSWVGKPSFTIDT